MVKRYEVEFLPEAVDDIERIGKSTARRILEKIRWLAENFEGIVPERLSGEFKKALGIAVRYTSKKGKRIWTARSGLWMATTTAHLQLTSAHVRNSRSLDGCHSARMFSV